MSEYSDGKACDLTRFRASPKTRANRLLIRAHHAGIHGGKLAARNRVAGGDALPGGRGRKPLAEN